MKRVGSKTKLITFWYYNFIFAMFKVIQQINCYNKYLGNAYHPLSEDRGLKTVCFHTTPALLCGGL